MLKKYICYLFISLLFLFLSITHLFSDEYHGIMHAMPAIELNFNLAQPKTNTLSDLHPRAQHLCKMIQRNVAPQFHQKTKLTYALQPNPIAYAHPSSIIDHLSKSIRLKRSYILKKFMENNPEIHKFSSKKYSISRLNKEYLAFNNIDTDSLKFCRGNTLQHVIHEEFILLTNTTAHIWNHQLHTQEIKELTTVIGNFINAGISFNHAGEMKKAIALADASWALFDCILAAGEGIIDGIATIAHDIIHPIQTAQKFTNAAISCGHYLVTALQEIDSVATSIISGNFDAAHSKYMTWCENFKNIAQALDAYCEKLTARDAIKTIMSSLVQCYATTRMLNGFSSFFSTAHKNTINIARKINEGVQESTLLMSAEGIPFRIAQETLKQMKVIPCPQDKLLKALTQFEHQIIRVGNVTCLLDKKGLKHILERHHPRYWNGTIKPYQTFLDKNITISEIVDIIKQIIKQNRKLISKQGVVNGQVDGVINKVRYRVGFKNGRIGQFYIPITE